MSESEDDFVHQKSEDDEVEDVDDDFEDEKPKKASKPKAVKGEEKEKAPAKKPKKDAPKKEKSSSDSPKKKTEKKNIEETYKKLDHIEHALQRPDMYIGSIKLHENQEMWVYDKGVGINQRQISFVPGLYKIFDEILVNAADNKQRDSNMKYLKVEIDPASSKVSVENDGEGIPVVVHEKEKMYVPEMIFGHLLTGSNFDDTVKKVTGGRNGLGAKLANIFSKEFTVETMDHERGKYYSQKFYDNMSKRDKPEVKSKSGKSYTKISFIPDLARFGMTKLDDDIIALMSKRVYDIAGCLPGLTVSLNGEKLPIKTFKNYCELYLKDPLKPKVHEKLNDRWEMCISLSDGEFQQVSFVNSICTMKGGKHVDHLVKKLVKPLVEEVNKKAKKLKNAELNTKQVKQHLFVFVNCLIENPAFDSQLKENLTTPEKEFGSKATVSDEIFKKIKKCGIVERILTFSQALGDQMLIKKGGGKKSKKLSGIAKLDDANEAGGKNGHLCTLILTEGDSARATAISGLAVVGRDYYGVFPLRGKLLNVREMTPKQILENEEINNIRKILGLQHGKTYTSIKELRYGHLMIMTDQDHDGSHIKGLLLNFIHHFWPSLLKIPGFMREFITPIVKARKASKEETFYTIPEYEQWKEAIEEKGEKGWRIKYYKGLGTSTAQEAREYFNDLDTHQIDFQWTGDNDGELIDMAFNKKRAEDRKEWMRGHKAGTFLDHHALGGYLPYHDFINKELVLFSIADCERSIPSVVDGLKPGQRKIMFSCFKRKLKNDIKVAQLSGYVSENSAYHHGEASLQSTIVNLAQNFVGSNNVNLLVPNGQFGTRLMGGKDAASARYIHTKLSELTRLIFHVDDDPILEYLDEDGLSIEPKWYMPIIPMVLVNGAEGIGTGWSTSIPCYNPMEIAQNIKKMMNDEEIVTMMPWYKGFKGTVVPSVDKKKATGFKISGVWKVIDDDTLEITELPIGTWTQQYKEMLEKLMADENSFVKSYKEYHTDTKVHFVIQFNDGKLKDLEKSGKFEQTLKLTTSASTSNMVAFDSEGRIRKYESPEEVLKDFYMHRLQYYEKRKEHLIKQRTDEWSKLDNRVRFILAVIKEELIVRNRKRADLVKELETKGFDKFKGKGKKASKKKEGAENESDDEKEEEEVSETQTGYDYLLSMPIWSLTLERVQKLLKEKEAKEAELEELTKTPVKTMWTRDIDSFIEHLKKWLEEEEFSANQIPAKKGKGGGRKKAPVKKRKKEEDDIEDDFAVKKAAAKKPTTTTTKAAVTKTEIKDEPKSSATASKPTKNSTLDSFFKKVEEKKPEIKKEIPKPKLEADDDDIPLSLRLARKAPEARSSIESLSTPPPISKSKKKNVVEDSSEEEDKKTKTASKNVFDISDDDEPKKAKKTTAPKKEAPKKETAKKEAPKKEAAKKEAPKKEAPKKETTKKAAPKKKKNDSDEEDELSDIMEVDPAPARGERSQRNTKKEIKYTFEDDESESEEDYDLSDDGGGKKKNKSESEEEEEDDE